MISREARLYVAKEIEHYHATKKEINNIETDIIFGKTFNEEGSLHSDVVSAKVTALVTHKTLIQMRNFVEAFEGVYERLTDEKKKVIYLLYWSDRDINCHGVGLELGVDGSTVGKWKNSILNQIAQRMGLS